MVDANIELNRKDRIGNVDSVIKIAARIWQRVKVQNCGRSRIEATRWDLVTRKGRSVDIMDYGPGKKTREITIPHGLAGHILLLGPLGPEPHAFVIAKEEGVLPPKRSTKRTPKIVCAFCRLNHLGHDHSCSVQSLVLKILKCGSMKYVCAGLAGCRNVRRVAIFRSAARPLHLHFCNAFRGDKHLSLGARRTDIYCADTIHRILNLIGPCPLDRDVAVSVASDAGEKSQQVIRASAAGSAVIGWKFEHFVAVKTGRDRLRLR